jgi:hypothetical protein
MFKFRAINYVKNQIIIKMKTFSNLFFLKKNDHFTKSALKCFSNIKGLENNTDIINNHITVKSGLERWRLIFENSYKAITNPKEYSGSVFFFSNNYFNFLIDFKCENSGTPLSDLGDLTSYSALLKIKEKMMYKFN